MVASPARSTVAVSDPGLPAYGDHVSSHAEEAAQHRRGGPCWPYLAVIGIGAALVVVPLLLGMFNRAAQGQQMIATFAPYMSHEQVDSFRADLGVVESARQNVLALQANGHTPAGQYPYVDGLVRDYPGIDRDMSNMLDSMSANIDNFWQLASLPPFGLLPWFFALPGLAIVVAGVLGLRRNGRGKRTPVVWSVIGLLAFGLVAAPFAFGIFAKAPAGSPLIEDFRPLLTHEQVRKVQGYFVTLAGGQGELNSRYTKGVLAEHPDANIAEIGTLEQRWQPMTSEFAGLIGVMNDNVGNFAAVAALNDTTKPLGFAAFDEFGWFFVVPGVLIAAIVGLGPIRASQLRKGDT